MNDLSGLVQEIVDIESVSGNETELANQVEQSLSQFSHLGVVRIGNTVVASTNFSQPSRVIIAGHLDTVPVADNLPSYVDSVDGRDVLYGRGTCDMKGGVAVQLFLAAHLTEASRDVTWIFYDCEEVEASRNGLGRLLAVRPDLLTGDMAILMEPTDARIEAGCQGTLRIKIHCQGVAAHSARSWMGHNAIHEMAGALNILSSYTPVEVVIDSHTYREGLNAVSIDGGIAGNVIPDQCWCDVNYRYAPDKTETEALDILGSLFAGYQWEVTDSAPGALPGLDSDIVSSFVAQVGNPYPKYGWTDVARFAQLGIPSINFGPGDPNYAHTDEERVDLTKVEQCRDTLMAWLTS
jgi:succinyl-diaminopimelate desuccinylase